MCASRRAGKKTIREVIYNQGTPTSQLSTNKYLQQGTPTSQLSTNNYLQTGKTNTIILTVGWCALIVDNCEFFTIVNLHISEKLVCERQ